MDVMKVTAFLAAALDVGCGVDDEASSELGVDVTSVSARDGSSEIDVTFSDGRRATLAVRLGAAHPDRSAPNGAQP